MQKVKSQNKTDLRICIIDFPYPEKVRHSYKFTYNLVRILRNITDTLYVISDKIPKSKIDDRNVHIIEMDIAPHFLRDIKPKWLSLLLWILKNILIQIKICINLLRISKNVDIVIFFMMFPYSEVVPMFLAKCLKKIVIKAPVGPAPKGKVYAPLGYSIYRLFDRLSQYLSDYLIVEYESILEQLRKYDQIKYPEKIPPPAHFFVLEDSFKIKKSIGERDYIVGYIGGFREIKGVLNFVKAIPIVLSKNDKIKFFIAGEGVLKDQIEEQIKKYPKDRVTLMDWIPHEKLPDYLNELKLLVIPSYSESGPFIAFEAIACGTPVLATRVGIIPLIIKDGRTGFILEDNSPECIADSILNALSHNNLYRITIKARGIVNRKYSFSATIKRWKKVLNSIQYKHANRLGW